MLFMKYVLDKGCHHKRQYRFYTWNHFLDGWSKAICKAFHTGCDHIVYDQTELLLLLANKTIWRVAFCTVITTCWFVTAYAFWINTWQILLFTGKKHFKKCCNTQWVFISYILKKTTLSILVYDNNGSIRLHLLFL